MDRKKIHEDYHSIIKPQKRVISENNFTYRVALSLLKKYFKDTKSILDIGCGVGTVDFFLAIQKKEVFGIDISKRAISAAKENAKLFRLENKIHYKVIDFPRQTIVGRYDGVVISEVLEHLDSDRNAVKKVYKLLKNNGVVLASSPSKDAPLFRLGLLGSFDRKVGHLRRYSEYEFRYLFESNNFRLIKLIKTEGILRNFLFTNHTAGKLIRFIQGPISDLITIVDNLTIPLFGESNYYIVAEKL